MEKNIQNEMVFELKVGGDRVPLRWLYRVL